MARKTSFVRRNALTISGIYLAAATAWIVFCEWLPERMPGVSALAGKLSDIESWLIVLLSAAFLYLLSGRTLARVLSSQEKLLQSERFTRNLVDALPQHIAILDETGAILSVNQAWRNYASRNGGTAEDTCERANYLAVCAASGQQCQEAVAFTGAIHAVFDGTLSEFSLEYPCDTPDRPAWYLGRVTRFAGPGPRRVIVTHEDITELKQAELAIRHLANHDPLTGLPNRSLFFDRLSQAAVTRHLKCKIRTLDLQNTLVGFQGGF